MIEQIGKSLQARTDATRTQAPKAGTALSHVDAPGVSAPAPAVASPASTLAAEGAPVDSDKVAAIRAAIANGSYKINPQAIAEKMVALDLGGAQA